MRLLALLCAFSIPLFVRNVICCSHFHLRLCSALAAILVLFATTQAHATSNERFNVATHEPGMASLCHRFAKWLRSSSVSETQIFTAASQYSVIHPITRPEWTSVDPFSHMGAIRAWKLAFGSDPNSEKGEALAEEEWQSEKAEVFTEIRNRNVTLATTHVKLPVEDLTGAVSQFTATIYRVTSVMGPAYVIHDVEGLPTVSDEAIGPRTPFGYDLLRIGDTAFFVPLPIKLSYYGYEVESVLRDDSNHFDLHDACYVQPTHHHSGSPAP